jgi:thiamine kinase-like enzyme
MTEVAKRILDTPGLNGDVYAFSKRVFTALEKVDIQKEQNTVIHNDLHLFNMLVNPDSHEFTGAIDWTDICIGPVARDFAVWEWRHDGSLEKAAQIYKDKTGKSLDIMQARLWKYVENISDIVEATESHDTAKVKECLERINLWSSTYDTLNKV